MDGTPAADAPAAESQRPQTSTRDPKELAGRLRTWMADRLPPGASPLVSELRVPEGNGMSSETVLFDATWQEDGRDRAESLVARLAPPAGAVPVFPAYDLGRQFDVMRHVGELSSVPVPRVYWSEPDPAPLGSAFFVMERIDGRVPPDILPYSFGSWLSDADEADQSRLQEASVAVLAALHQIIDPQLTFAFLEHDRQEPTALGRHVGEQWAYYQWVAADGLRSPLIERAFAWLEQHWPRQESSSLLSWGDARIGNIIYQDFEPVAVLDWEMAAIGPPEVDVGWMIYLHRFFEDLAMQYGFPGMPRFMRRDDVAATYESLTGNAPRDLDFYTLYAALRHAIIMSRIHRRSIHFGEATMPDDVDDMIPHRLALEAMLAGTYWS